MQVTRETDYAVRCVLEVAKHGRMSAAEVAARQNLSLPFLGKIVHSLARAGILATQRGIGGGMQLARPPGEITVYDVFEAIEGPLALNICLCEPCGCERAVVCEVMPVWKRAQEALISTLTVSFEQLLDDWRPSEESTRDENVVALDAVREGI